jgi:hypothetical protein
MTQMKTLEFSNGPCTVFINTNLFVLKKRKKINEKGSEKTKEDHKMPRTT